jgi:hypothetical protein
MRRRDFVAGLSGMATWSLAARAQQGERMRRVGVLFATAGTSEEDTLCWPSFWGPAHMNWLMLQKLEPLLVVAVHDSCRCSG